MSQKKEPGIYFLVNIIASLFTSLWLGLTPSLTENPFFLNFSLQRFVFILITVLVLVLFCTEWVLVRKTTFKTTFAKICDSRFIHAAASFWGLVCGLLILSVLMKILGPRTVFFSRLLPILFLGFVMSTSWLIFQEWMHRWQFGLELRKKILSEVKLGVQNLNKNVNDWENLLKRPGPAILFLIIINAPVLFINSFRYHFPLGFAGLYSQMAEEIANNYFLLPKTIPYYGPGGIPFSYPPLGAYLMALTTKVFSISAFDYVRFAAPLFYLIATVLFYFLVARYTKSKTVGWIAAILMGYSSLLYDIQATAGGIFRSLALVFLLAGLLVFAEAVQKARVRTLLLSGLFFALTLLCHLGYAFIFALVLLVSCLVKPFSINRWKTAILTGLAGILFSSPWWVLVVTRFGWTVFINAFGSHGNAYFLSILSGEKPLFPWLAISLESLLSNPYLAGLAILGLLYLLLNGDIFLPLLAFGLMFSSSENGRFLIMIGAISAGVILNQLCRAFQLQKISKNLSVAGLTFLIACLVVINSSEAQKIMRVTPAFDSETLAFTNYVRQNVPSSAEFLFVGELEGGSTQGTEWLPYLLKLKPSIGSWGGEWVGTTSDSNTYADALVCEKMQSWSCLNDLIAKLSLHPTVLITYAKDTQLNQEIIGSDSWLQKKDDGVFDLWIKREN